MEGRPRSAVEVLSGVDPQTALVLLEGEGVRRADPTEGSAGNLFGKAGLNTRVVRGRKMRSLDGLFDEFAAALQFESYFGENWPAFAECLSERDDLSPSAGLSVLVLEPNQVLADAHDAELPVLVRIIQSTAVTYAEPIERGEWWDRAAIPSTLLL
jgi:hypothetical protein